MKLNSLALNKFRLKCLDPQTVKGRCAVQEHRVSLENVFEDIPDNRILAIDNFLGRFDGLNYTAFNKLPYYERLVKLCRHIFRQAAFMEVEFRTNNNYRAG